MNVKTPIIPETNNKETKKVSGKLLDFFGKDMGMPEPEEQELPPNINPEDMYTPAGKIVMQRGKQRLFDVKGEVNIIKEGPVIPGRIREIGYMADYTVGDDKTVHNFYTE